MSADLQTALRRLYDAEIECSLESQWDAGWVVSVGTERRAFRRFHDEELPAIAGWLLKTAAVLYPDRIKA